MRSMSRVIAATIMLGAWNRPASGGAMPEFSIPAEVARLLDEAKEARAAKDAKAAPASLRNFWRVIAVLGIVEQADAVIFQLSHGFTVRMHKGGGPRAAGWTIETQGMSDHRVTLEASKQWNALFDEVIFNNNSSGDRLEIIDENKLGRTLFLYPTGIVRLDELTVDSAMVYTRITPAGIRIFDQTAINRGVEAWDRQGRRFTTKALNIDDKDLLGMTSVEELKRFCSCGKVQYRP